MRGLSRFLRAMQLAIFASLLAFALAGGPYDPQPSYDAAPVYNNIYDGGNGYDNGYGYDNDYSQYSSEEKKCGDCGKIKQSSVIVTGSTSKPFVKYFEKDGCKYAFLSCGPKGSKLPFVLAAEDVNGGTSTIGASLTNLAGVKAISLGLNPSALAKCKGHGKFEATEIGGSSFKFKKAVCYQITASDFSALGSFVQTV